MGHLQIGGLQVPLSEPTDSIDSFIRKWATPPTAQKARPMSVTIEQVDDLRKTYLTIFDNFAMNNSELADEMGKGFNTRYVRELAGALQHGGLVLITEDGDGADVWQTIQTYDDITREEAEAKFNEWAKVKPPSPVNATSTSSPARSAGKAASREPHECLCGCGEVLTTRSLYRPGHDARHAGQVGRAVAEIMNGGHDEGDQIEIDRLYGTLGSDLLRSKAERVADNANRKNLAKAKPEYPDVDGIVKVGKNEYPAKREASGVVRFLKPGATEWATASKTAAKTFQEG